MAERVGIPATMAGRGWALGERCAGSALQGFSFSRRGMWRCRSDRVEEKGREMAAAKAKGVKAAGAKDSTRAIVQRAALDMGRVAVVGVDLAAQTERNR